MKSRSPAPQRIAAVLFTGFCLSLLILHLARFFLRIPPVWPDESLFGAPALDLIQRGKMGTPLLAEVLPGIGEHTYWMPPVYFMALAPVFKLFGTSIVVMRGFTLLISLGVIALTLLLALEIGAGAWGAVVAFGVLAIHPLFASAMVLGRMEALVMLFLFASAWIVARELNRAEGPRLRTASFAGAGFLAGLAAMTHPFGIVGCAALGVTILFHSPRGTSLVRRLRVLLLAALAALVTVIPWGLYILQSPENFKAQFGGQLARKAAALAGVSLFDLVRMNFGTYATQDWIVGALLFLASFVGIALCVRKRRGAWMLVWSQVFLFLMLNRTKEMWYPVYLVPLSAIGLGVMTHPQWTRRAPRVLAWAFCVIAWLGTGYWVVRGSINRFKDFAAMSRSHASPTAYLGWSEEISRGIPPNKRVLIASIPDPTFALFSRPDLELRHFSPVRIDPVLYQRYIESADYIVYSERYVDDTIKNFARAHAISSKLVALPEDPEYNSTIAQMHP